MRSIISLINKKKVCWKEVLHLQGWGLCRRSVGIGHNFRRARVFPACLFFVTSFFYFCMPSQADPSQRCNGGQLWSPVEKNQKDGEQRCHGGRDEAYGSSALHRVLLERRNADRKCQNATQKCSMRAHVCVCVSKTSG